MVAVVMTMEFEEFEAALIMCAQISKAANKQSASKNISTVLSEFLLHMYKQCPELKLKLMDAD